jgi:hypothetical protein
MTLAEKRWTIQSVINKANMFYLATSNEILTLKHQAMFAPLFSLTETSKVDIWMAARRFKKQRRKIRKAIQRLSETLKLLE